MGRFMRSLGTVALVAGAAVYVYAQHRSTKTGKDIGTVLSNLPEELKATQAEWEKRIRAAIDVGLRAAAAKEAEIDQELGEEERQAPAQPPDYVV